MWNTARKRYCSKWIERKYLYGIYVDNAGGIISEKNINNAPTVAKIC